MRFTQTGLQTMLITNGTLITWGMQNAVIANGAVYVQDGMIADMGDAAELGARYPHAERLDARGQLIMPGLICAHTHFYGAYARGMAIPGEPPRDFPEILRRLWWNLDKALDADAVRMSALVCLVDAIRHGTTTLFDHHASPNAIDGSLDVIADAVTQAGLRAVLCYEVTDRDGLDKAEAGTGENLRFMRTHRNHPLLRGTFGLHASLSLSDATLERVASVLNADEGVHIHVAEHEADEDDSLSQYRLRVVERLAAFGLLRPQTILAHCVHIDDRERALIREHGCWVTHQPRSNMNNAVGAMAFDTMMREGVQVCIGNDGFSNAMWEEWKAAYLLHKITHRDPRLANGADVARVGAQHNAALASAHFSAPIGALAIGAQADIILVDYQPYTPLTSGNLPWHILFGFEPSMVTTTICAGKLLMRDRQLLTLDAAAIARNALALADDVWARYAAIAG
jgi:putative selenium metabolism protein SsnA